MLSNFVKSILTFNRSQTKAPNFILVYSLITIIWHSEVLLAFALAHGGFVERASSALAESSLQYLWVLWFSVLFYVVRLSWLYFINKADQFIDQDEVIEAKVGSDQIFKENKDVVRLLALLDENKTKLENAKSREAASQHKSTETINKMLSMQVELDLALADIAILTKSNAELKAQINHAKIL